MAVNLASGMAGLTWLGQGCKATPWFDACSASSVFAAMAILVAVGVFGAGGRLNGKAQGPNTDVPRSYVWNAVAVVIGGAVGDRSRPGLKGCCGSAAM